MKNSTKLILSILALTILSAIPLNDWLGIELRSISLTKLYDSIFFILFASFLATVFFVTIKAYNGTWHIFIVIFVPLLFLLTCILGLLVSSRPVYWEDNAVFKSAQSDNYLIYQTFWFGITADNPKCRPILTSSKNNLIRPITILPDSTIPQQIVGGYGYNFDSIPKTIQLGEESYRLIDVRQ